jgi:2-polyprenyl-6-methoxyphenol hydroxylase-like FAD-dependent oxidoreductase
MSHATHDTDVLIVGGGPVGFTLAIDLHQRGVRVTLVEREFEVNEELHGGGHNNMRTAEQFRRLGLLDKLKSETRAISQAQALATAVFGQELSRFPIFGRGEFTDAGFAAEASFGLRGAPLTRLLKRHTLEVGIDVRSGHEFESLTQDGERVVAIVRNLATQDHVTLAARYLVASDGSRSAVRRSVGIVREGDEATHKNLRFTLRVLGEQARELVQPPDEGIGPFWFLFNEHFYGTGSSVTPDGLFAISVARYPIDQEPTDAEIQEFGRRLLGRQADFEVLNRGSWRQQRLVATRYREGRVFLAGDAAHVHPANGGNGLNLGVGDAVDLAWKLAAVTQGWGGAGLLDSYDAERRQVGEQISRYAWGNAQALHDANEYLRKIGGLPAGDDARTQAERRHIGEHVYYITSRHWDSNGAVLDQRYVDSPIVVDDGTVPPTWHPSIYRPIAKPGHRAPHIWLDRAANRSLYDEFGPGFTLLAVGAPETGEWERFDQAARQRSLPVNYISHDTAEFRRFYGRRYVLIRPDKHVAWRGDALPSDLAALIDTVRGARAPA